MKTLLLSVCVFVLIGCAPKSFEPIMPKKLEFTPTSKYVFDISKLEKPSKPEIIFLGKDFKPTTEDKAAYLAFAPGEFAKIVALNRLANAQSEIIMEHVHLVNTKIELINSLKEIVALKEAEIESYFTLWVNSENAYRQELHEHKIDNAISHGLMYIISIGSIILLAVGL